MAGNCIRTLLLSSPKTPADQSIARHLLPHLLAFTTTSSEDPEKARSLIAHTLTSYISTLPTDKKLPGMAVVVPTLLERANKEGESTWRETSARLLELAAADQGAFRGVVGSMSGEQKAFMESVILKGRSAVIDNAMKSGNDDGEGEPTIALRMDFGV